MSIRIITGSTGTNHVTSQDDGSLNQVILGSKSVVLDIGEKLAAVVVDNNTVRISDGDLLLQGRHARIDAGTVEDMTIGTGTIEMNRNDLIVARYTLDTGTGFENIELIVLEGTETSGSASDPAYNTGDIRTGSSIVDFPLYRVRIEGINIAGLVRLFEISGGANSSLIGNAYSATKSYRFGEVCIDNGIMWASKTNNNQGNTPVEGTYWTKSSIAQQMGGVMLGLDGDGNPGYYKADGSLNPFKSGAKYTINLYSASTFTYKFVADSKYKISIKGSLYSANWATAKIDETIGGVTSRVATAYGAYITTQVDYSKELQEGDYIEVICIKNGDGASGQPSCSLDLTVEAI